MINIAIFASGNGTNAENIVKTFNSGTRIRVKLLFTENPDAYVIKRMEALNVPTICIPRSDWKNNPARIISILRKNNIHLIILAGFLTFVHPAILEAYPKRVLNIHPSLLPKHGGKGMYGMHVHNEVISQGDTESGATVHFVTPEIDAGEILMQESVPVYPDDTPETLAERVHHVEHSLFPKAILKLADEMESQPPTVEQEWADALQIKYDGVPPVNPAPTQTPPPYGPQATPEPPMTQEAPSIPSMEEPQPQENPESMEKRETIEPMPNTYLLWSILVTLLCCTIVGIVAIVFSCQVSSRYFNGNYEGARQASRLAEIWIIASFVLGVLSATVWGPLMFLF